MLNKARLISSKDHVQWNNALAHCNADAGEHNSIYARHEYADLYCRGKSQAYLFSFMEKDQYFSMPLIVSPIEGVGSDPYFDFESPYGYSGIFTNASNPIFFDRAWAYFKKVCKKNRIIAGFLRFNPLGKAHSRCATEGVRICQTGEVIVLDLNKKAIFSGYKSKVRTTIRKAKKRKITIVQDAKKQLSGFRSLYLRTMDRVGARGFYRFDADYFKTFEEKLNQNYYILYAQNADSSVIGGILVLIDGESAVIHLSACQKACQNDGVPSLLRHEAIMAAKKMGLKTMNMGGGLSKGPDCPLFRFKAGFSPERKKYYTAKCILNHEIYHGLCREWEEKNGNRNNEFFLKYRLEKK